MLRGLNYCPREQINLGLGKSVLSKNVKAILLPKIGLKNEPQMSLKSFILQRYVVKATTVLKKTLRKIRIEF